MAADQRLTAITADKRLIQWQQKTFWMIGHGTIVQADAAHVTSIQTVRDRMTILERPDVADHGTVLETGRYAVFSIGAGSRKSNSSATLGAPPTPSVVIQHRGGLPQEQQQCDARRAADAIRRFSIECGLLQEQQQADARRAADAIRRDSASSAGSRRATAVDARRAADAIRRDSASSAGSRGSKNGVGSNARRKDLDNRRRPRQKEVTEFDEHIKVTV